MLAKKLCNNPATGFDWESISAETESARIKHNTQRFKSMSIEEAFAEAYPNETLGEHRGNYVAMSPYKPKVNDFISVNLASVSKSGTYFEALNIKEDIVSRVDLWKYKKFRDFTPNKPMLVKVLEVTKDKIFVDPLSPMLDMWLQRTLDDPKSQRDLTADRSIEVRDLKLMRGGYVGKVNIPTISEFVGENVYLDAFIPGSQIVLNIERDFARWDGETVRAFISNYVQNPKIGNAMSLICSVKDYLNFKGDQNKVQLFKHYTEDDDFWKSFVAQYLPGVVTGVINSSKKCGVFVEIPTLNITGFVTRSADELVQYKPQMEVSVRLVGFDESMYYNADANQMQHKLPFNVVNGILDEVTIKPILEL